MVQSVTEREGEIMEEVKNVCQKTIEQIKHLATEIENPMKNEEEILNRVMTGEEFQTENDGDFIKCLYYYHELKLMKNKYVTRDHSDAQFSLELRVLSVEKIVELVGFVTSDEHKSSDEDSENIEILPLLHESNINDKSLPYQYKKQFTNSRVDAIVLVSPEKKFLSWEKNLYHLSKTETAEKLVDVEDFTYVPDTDEIIYVLKNRLQGSKIFRRPLHTDGKGTLFITLRDEQALCIKHNAGSYLVILSESVQSNKSSKLYVRIFNEIGCLTKPTCSYVKHRIMSYLFGRIKICHSSFVQISSQDHAIFVYKGFTFDCLFSYSGCIGCDPSCTFYPADVCTDSDDNFLVIDSKDNTVHLLDPNGKFLRIIMSAEDGLSGITRVAIDTFGWLWMGNKDGSIHFANYQHFKSTTRQDRYLEKFKV